MKSVRLAILVVVVLLVAHGVDATFRAADLVVVPVAANNLTGVGGSSWQTDLEIMNLDSVAIDVMIVFLPSGGSSNAAWFADMGNHLGGRKEDNFGHIDERLKDIQPSATVNMENVVKTWGDYQKGALLVFAYEAGSLMKTTPPGGNPKRIIVNTRTYTSSTTEDGTTHTYGQSVPGLPWYDYISPGLKDKNLDHVIFTGLREDASYRTALGLVNISDRLTSLIVQLVLKGPDGVEVGNYGVSLAPLAHDQYDRVLSNIFGLSQEEAHVNMTLQVNVKAFVSGGAADETTPAMLCYVSKVDNSTNDPSFYEQTYDQELPWDCVFNGHCSSAVAPVRSQISRVLSHLRPPTPGFVSNARAK
jgi:hypothetical protein